MDHEKLKIRLGPIIGKVTYNTARISIEFEYSKEVNEVICILTSPKGKHFLCRCKPEKNFPTVFKFEELDPRTLYSVSVHNLPPVKSSFTTLKDKENQSGDLQFAVISCNEKNTKTKAKNTNQDLWMDLAKRVKLLDYIFHIGNQCYMDRNEENNEKSPYQICKEKLSSTPQEEWNSLSEELLEVLREQYRKTWSHRPTAYVLANVPNLMILDSHEIRDEWGWREEDYNPNTTKIDYFYGQLARRVYYEYQRQLREDIDWEDLQKMKCEYHEHTLNGVGVVLVDYCGSRTWFREDSSQGLHLGLDQLTWIKDLFSNEGNFNNVNSVMFLSPIPLFFFSHILVSTKIINEAQEQWTSKNNKELKKLMTILRYWKEQKSGRDITLISGNVSIGGHTEIFYKGERLFKQLTTSAINNKSPNRYEELFKRFFEGMNKKNGNEYSYNHYNWIRENNYALVEVKTLKGESSVVCNLVYRGTNEVRTQESHDNKNWQTKTECCHIF